MPNTPWVGYKPRTWVKSHQYVGYTSIWNLLDYAALTIPVTTASRTKDGAEETTNGCNTCPGTKATSSIKPNVSFIVKVNPDLEESHAKNGYCR